MNDFRLLLVWIVIVAVSMGLLAADLRRRNASMGGLMKLVWMLTVLYSGPLGLAIYYYSGRAQIARDSLWRRSFRSVAHCYSGCGAGEVIGVVLTAGVLALGTWWVAGVSFFLRDRLQSHGRASRPRGRRRA